MIHEILFILMALAVGMALGIINFAGLWSTALYVSQVKRPALLLLISFIVRMTLVLATFYLVMSNHWERLIACAVGFFIVRQILIRRLQPEQNSTIGMVKRKNE